MSAKTHMNANGDALCYVCSLSEDTNTFGMLQKKTYIPFILVLQKAHIAINLRTMVMWWWWWWRENNGNVAVVVVVVENNRNVVVVEEKVNNRNVVAVEVVVVVVVVEEINRDVVVVVVEGKQDRVSQKFVPLILRAIAFERIKNLFLEAVYCSIEYMYSEFQ